MADYKAGVMGVSYAGSAPPTQTRRKYGRNDQVWMKALADAPMLHMMTQKLNKQAVGEIKYYMWEDDYYPQTGTLKGCTVDGVDAALAVGTQYVYVTGEGSVKAAQFLTVGDILHVPAFQTNRTNTQGTGGTTDGTAQIAGEDFTVRAIVSDYVIQVTRNGGDSSTTGRVTANSASTLNWEWKTGVFADASGSPSSVAKDITEDYNYREIMRLSWSVSGRNVMQDMYAGSDLQRLRVAKRTQFFRGVERKFWTNHRYLLYSGNSLEESHSGGFVEYVADINTSATRIQAYDASEDLVTGTGSQRVWLVNKNFSLNNIDKFMERAFKFGSKNKFLVAGRGFVTKFQSLLRPYYGGFDWGVSEYGFDIAYVKCAFGRIPLIIEQEFSSGANAYDYWAAIVDMNHLGYRYGKGACVIKGCNAQNSDIHVHTEIQANDEAISKEELFCDIGFWQVFRKAHALIIWDGTE